MMAILVPSALSLTMSAEILPWLGSVKHIWKTLDLRAEPSPTTSTEEADGVSSKMLSLLVSADTATHGAVVVVPIRICRPQSLRLLYALTEVSALWVSSWQL